MKSAKIMKSIEFYLSKGFDRKTAEYFASGRKKITSVVPKDDFTLILSFDNGEKRSLDVKPFMEQGTVFEKISNREVFNRVYLDEEKCVSWDIDPNIDSRLEWNNKIDLCPDSCYIDSIPV